MVLKCKYYVLAITFLSVFSACRRDKYGKAYNAVRKQQGSPLIKNNMRPGNCCGEWTIYEITELPSNKKPVHFSKTVRVVQNDVVTNEEDIYRRDLDDTTLLQLNLLTVWRISKQKLDISGNVGKIDKRSLKKTAIEHLQTKDNYPNYPFLSLSESGIDSVLTSWGLSRTDPEDWY